MRMIPDYVSDRTKSAAERRLFPLLAASVLPSPAWGFHSLNISEHDYKLWGELDFVVLSPRGLLVLEVKGGGVACEDGVWIYTDRFGHAHRKSEGPFDRRSPGCSLRSPQGAPRVRPRPAAHRVRRGVPRLPVRRHERRVVRGDRPRQAAAPRRDGSLRGLGALRLLVGRNNGAVRPPMLLHECGSPAARLPAGPLPARAPMRSTAHGPADRRAVRAVRHHRGQPSRPRSGGAGTGKTFLAAETARRHAAVVEGVLLTCHSHILAAFLTSRLPSGAHPVSPFGELAGGRGTATGSRRPDRGRGSGRPEPRRSRALRPPGLKGGLERGPGASSTT